MERLASRLGSSDRQAEACARDRLRRKEGGGTQDESRGSSTVAAATNNPPTPMGRMGMKEL